MDVCLSVLALSSVSIFPTEAAGIDPQQLNTLNAGGVGVHHVKSILTFECTALNASYSFGTGRDP